MISPELLEALTQFCNENSIGLGQVYWPSKEVAVIVFSKTEPIDNAYVLAAYMLLNGVVSGRVVQANITAQDQAKPLTSN